MIFKNNKIKYNRGYTLVFAVIVSSLVLAVGVSILNISRKEFLLASTARESTYAFYAADSGLECAKYHADKGRFATSSTYGTMVSNLAQAACAGKTVSNRHVTSTGTYTPYDFGFDLELVDPDGDASNGVPCAVVVVRKEYITDSLAGKIPLTTINSYGYNNGWSNSGGGTCDTPSPNRVERSLRYTY